MPLEDKDNGIGWVISRLIPSHHKAKKQSETAKWCYNEFRVKYCPRCLNVWDHSNSSTIHVNIYYYKDFPKYKLDKEVCFVCEPKNYKGKKRMRIIV